MNRIALALAQAIVAIALLSGFGWVVKHRTKGDLNLGVANAWVDGLSGFPDRFQQSVEAVQTLPQTFVPTPDDWSPINRLDEDVWALTAHSNEQSGRTFRLQNLRDGQVEHTWRTPESMAFKPHWRAHNPLMLEDRSLVSFVTNRSPLFRLDSTSALVWRQDSLSFHHAMNLDANGMLWVCAQQWEQGGRHVAYRGRYRMGDKTVHFLDNSVAQIDPSDGRILQVISMADILRENDLGHLVLRSGDPQDPLHLNDVEPALHRSRHFEEGDLFLSFRNLQAVLQYRPSTREVVRTIQGPLAAQHDVDILNDSTLVIFNNATQENFGRYTSNKDKYPISKDQAELAQWHSELAHFNLRTGAFTSLFQVVMAQEGIMTFTEGLQDMLPSGAAFVEEQNSGVLWVLNEDGVLYKDVMASHHPGHHHLPNWTRIVNLHD